MPVKHVTFPKLMTMKKYSVNVHYDVVVPVEVNADTESEALQKAEDIAGDIDIGEQDNWPKHGIEIVDSSSCVTDVEEIKTTTSSDVLISIGRPDLIDSEFDELEFLGVFHPNYNCDEIAWEGDIDKYLAGESEPGDCTEWVAKQYPDRFDAHVARLGFYCRNMLKAVENYEQIRYGSK